MAYQQRLCGENVYHHIYAWGNNRNPIFSNERHFNYYLDLMAVYADRYQIDIIAYALMEWHIHLFIHDRENSMAEFIQALHSVHAHYYNRETNRVGHAFGERYNNKIVQPNNHALCLSKYIHRQAVEAGLVKYPIAYEWTSYHRYIGLKPSGFVKSDIILDQFGEKLSSKEKIAQYADYVMNDKKRLVDWDKNDFNVVGDESFCSHIKKLNCNKNKVKIKPYDIIGILSSRLAIDRENLFTPTGTKERELRHEAFKILFNEYGYTYSEIARLFKVTRLTIFKTIKKHTPERR